VPFLGGIWGVVGASDTVVNMLAEVGTVGARRVARLETEKVTAHEVVPLDDLVIAVVVAARPSSGVGETAEGVTTEIGTMRVELSSEVISRKVDESLVDKTDDLDVVWGLHVLNTPKGITRDETSAVTGLSAPRDFFVFRLTNGGGTGRGCPKTKIVNRVNDESLAEGLLVFGRRVAPVVTGLCATDTIIRISLVWKVIVVEMLGSQGNEG